MGNSIRTQVGTLTRDAVLYVCLRAAVVLDKNIISAGGKGIACTHGARI